MREAFSQEQGNCEFGCLFYRPFDFKRVGFFSCVCIDIEGAPEVCSGLVGRVKINTDIRRLAFAKHDLLEGGGKAVAGRGDGVDYEAFVACIRIDKVEGIARIVFIERKVADDPLPRAHPTSCRSSG